MYKELYILQDEILALFFSADHSFYLTGGTALNRFYFNVRYSDDLDLFTNRNNMFSEEINMLVRMLADAGYDYSSSRESRDFARIIINKRAASLRIDFVNDYVFRLGLSNVINNVKVDNIGNIFANKISAVLNRDEAKDVCDLASIYFNEKIQWDEAFEAAVKKSAFSVEDFYYRLNSFPLDWFSRIRFIDGGLENDIRRSFEKMKQDVYCFIK